MEGITQKCDFCDEEAIYDGKTASGPWAFMCAKHFELCGVKVKGLYSVLKKPPAPTKKVCIYCHKEKPIDQFYRYKDAHNVERWRNGCKECYQADRRSTAFKKIRKDDKNGDGC